MISVINNVASLTAENALASTQASLQNTLTELSTGMRLTSGASDPAALSVANGLGANISALTQSSQNATDGIGLLQTADGALSQVTTLLNQAVTIATEASNGGLTTAQLSAADAEFTSIKNEITQIGSTTNFNGVAVFSSAAQDVYTTDGTSGTTTSTSIGTLSASGLSLTGSLTSASGAQAALTTIISAISTVAATRGTIGASVNQLNADTGVANTEVSNLTNAQNNIQNADIGQTVSQMTQYNVLEQTGMAALQQSNAAAQNVLKLLQ
jgi:flagellin